MQHRPAAVEPELPARRPDHRGRATTRRRGDSPGLRLPLRTRVVRARGARRRARLHRAAGRSDRGDGQQDGGAHARGRRTACRSCPARPKPLRDADEAARSVAEEFGYPVLLKAAAGGGGKGMRVVREDARARVGARRGAPRGEERLRRRRGLRREVHRRPAPRRDPGARRPARQHRVTSASASARCSAATRR